MYTIHLPIPSDRLTSMVLQNRLFKERPMSNSGLCVRLLMMMMTMMTFKKKY